MSFIGYTRGTHATDMVSIMLKEEDFQQIVKEATTIHGKCIDHIYM